MSTLTPAGATLIALWQRHPQHHDIEALLASFGVTPTSFPRPIATEPRIVEFAAWMERVRALYAVAE